MSKIKDASHPSLYLNNARIQRQSFRKHIGLFLDEKVSLLKHIEVKIKKTTVGVNLLRKLNLLLPLSFVRRSFVLITTLVNSL